MQPRLWRTSMQTIEVRCSHRAGHFRRHQLKSRSRFWRSNFWTPERLSSYVFGLPWFCVPTNFQYETPYILYSAPPPPLPPFMRIDRIWWIHVLEVQIYFLTFDCMTSNFICLGFTTLRSSSSWRIDTVIFAKLNKPLLPHQKCLK